MMTKKLLLNQQEIELEKLEHKKNQVSFLFKGQSYLFTLESDGVLVDSQGLRHAFLRAPNEVFLRGQRLEIEDMGRSSQKKGSANKGSLLSPMPGKILKVLVEVGESVSSGQSLLIMEAMKMEHTIKAPFDGVVKSLPYQMGDQIQAKVALLELTPLNSNEA